MSLVRTLLILACTTVCNSAKAEYADCNSFGTVRIWLGTAAQSVADRNPNTYPARISQIVSARHKRDGGKEADRLADLYNCTVIANEPTSSDRDGMYVWVFSEKRSGSTIKQRLAAEANSFQLWAQGGLKRAMAKGSICYEVKYKDERGAFMPSGYLMIEDPKIPMPKAVSRC